MSNVCIIFTSLKVAVVACSETYALSILWKMLEQMMLCALIWNIEN